MTEENRCNQCKGVLSADAPHGLCPRCLLKRGLETQTQYSQEGRPASDEECAPPTPEELAGLFPDLEILELIGRGGMGVVYKARQKRLHRLVALKILAPRFSRDVAFAERFVQEARAMAMLNHPHIVAVHDFGEVDGLYYFLMEFVDGVNLRRLLDTKKLASEEALAIVPQICEALQYAHDHGVVHRDIKPENVLLDKEGRVKIADFGIAKLVGVQGSGLKTQKRDASDDKALKFSSTEPLTAAGQIVGTPRYMAPEQVETPQAVDHRADIYSLGVVFYQMLTGELPTGHVAPSKKVQIDVRLDEVVLRAMEKEPARRYQQASEVKTEVEGIATTPLESEEAVEQDPASGSPSKVSMCYISTPEHLRSFQGRFINIYKGKGELRLDNKSLSFHSNWPTVVIPLSSIRKIAQGDYPYTAKPVPIHFIEVTFTEHGVERTLLFTPLLREIMFPQEANKVVAEWLSALLEAVQVSTGRTLSVEKSQVSQDRFWLAKTILLGALLPAICLMIPAILLQQMPSLLTVSLSVPIAVIVMTTMFLAMRWRQRRSAIASDNLAVGTTADQPAWQSPDSGWGWFIGKIFGTTFTSRLAYRCANLSALGFLGSLGCLGFMPGAGWMHGFFGLFGLFGLIGVAQMIEAFARPNLTTAKLVTMVTAAGMTVALLVSFLLVFFNVMEPPQRQEWRAKPKLVGPGIERVLIEENQATIEGKASAKSYITFAAGEEHQGYDFKKNDRFTAVVKRIPRDPGLEITIVDAYGNRLFESYLNTQGIMHSVPYRPIVFGKNSPEPQPDGTIQIAQGRYLDTHGNRLPITVRMSTFKPSTPKVGTKASGGEKKKAPVADHPPTGKIQPFDVLQIHAINTLLDHPINGLYIVEPDGNVSLGPAYGRANVKGLNVEQAAQSILKQLNKILKGPNVQVILAKRLDQRLNRWRKAEFPRSPYTIEPKDSLCVKVQGTLLEQPIDGRFTVESKGTIPLGPAYGRVEAKGLTLEEAEKAIKKHLQKILTDPEVQVTLPHRFVDSPAVRWHETKMPKAPYTIRPGELLLLEGSNLLKDQPIKGVHLVEPAGTVALGPAYGRVKIEGLTLEEAEKAIRETLRITLIEPRVSVTLGGWEGEGMDSHRSERIR